MTIQESERLRLPAQNLRFHGNGVNDIDRVKIQITPYDLTRTRGQLGNQSARLL